MIAAAVAVLFPDDPPQLPRSNPVRLWRQGARRSDLRAAGFREVQAETVAKRSRGPAGEAALGLCQGSPLRGEIEARAPERLDEAVDAASAALVRFSGSEAVDAAMPAHVFTASG